MKNFCVMAWAHVFVCVCVCVYVCVYVCVCVCVCLSIYLVAYVSDLFYFLFLFLAVWLVTGINGAWLVSLVRYWNHWFWLDSLVCAWTHWFMSRPTDSWMDSLVLDCTHWCVAAVSLDLWLQEKEKKETYMNSEKDNWWTFCITHFHLNQSFIVNLKFSFFLLLKKSRLIRLERFSYYFLLFPSIF